MELEVVTLAGAGAGLWGRDQQRPLAGLLGRWIGELSPD
jgi:hypothetical protein